MSITGIYEIVNLYDGKASSYVGSSADIEKRWANHRSALCAGRHDNAHLQAAWNLYGEDAFVFRVLEEVEGDMLSVMEQEYLSDYFDRGHCYNIAHDAVASMRGQIFTEEHKHRISKANKGQVPWNKGRTNVYSEECLGKMSDAQKGKKHTEETKRKVSEAKKGKTLSEEHKRKAIKVLIGRAVSEETRRKIGKALRGRKCSAQARHNMSEAQKGKRLTEEAKRKISEAHKGKKHTEETKRKISEANKGQVPWNTGKKRKPFTEETKRKMSVAAKQRWAKRRISAAKGKHRE